MRRRIGFYAVLGFALLLSSCTDGSGTTPLSDEVTTFPPNPTAETTTTTRSGGIETPSPPTIPANGRLVILDSEGNVVTVDPDGSDLQVLTDAAAESAAYLQPIWAPGSRRIAWSQADGSGFGLATADPSGRGHAVSPLPAAPFYFYWSPDGEQVAALHNGINGIELKLVDGEGGRARLVSSGAPFYFSWRPDSSGIVVHVGFDRLASIDSDGGATEIGPTDPGYSAPQWIPGGILHVEGARVLLESEAGESRVIAGVPGPAAFIANPAGTLLAIQSLVEGPPAVSVALQQAPDVRTNAVVVVDIETGEATTASQDAAVAFFWSPDGGKLLILTPGVPGEIEVSVWEAGVLRRITAFTPPSSFVRNVLPFFAQYAQSYQVWSPDSSAFAFAAEDENRRSGIWVQQLDGSPAVRVAGGTWVSWSDG